MRNAVVYVTDKKGCELTWHAATSFMLSQSNFHDLYIFCHNFMPVSTDRLIKIGRENGVRVHFEPIDDPRIVDLKSVGHITKTTFLKFESIDRVAHAFDRVLYIDHDILLFEDLFLEKINLEEHPVGAVYDIAEISGITNPSFALHCLQNNRSTHYFNAGFMLFDGSKWDPELKGRYFQLLNWHQANCDYKKNCKSNDQCVFNLLFEKNWKRLPLNFNMQGCAKFTDKWAHAPVRHYQGASKFLPVRPWRNDTRDINLIRRVRKVLGYNDPFHLPSFNILFGLNRIRNKPRIVRAEKAMAFAEQMFSKPMNESFTGTDDVLVA
jgi:lipopolysaccharide biosynthesis glycosyltransferase